MNKIEQLRKKYANKKELDKAIKHLAKMIMDKKTGKLSNA